MMLIPQDVVDLLAALERAQRRREILHRWLYACFIALIVVMVSVALAVGGVWPWPLGG